MGVIYLRSGRRRPVWSGRRIGMRDSQADIPAGWCIRCGREVFPAGKQLCPVCATRKERKYELQ